MNSPLKSPIFHVVRMSTSSYFESDFLEREKTSIEKIENGIVYHASLNDFLKTKTNDKIIAITNTHTKMDELKKIEAQLVLAIHPNSGYDNFTVDLVNKANFPIILGNPIREKAVSEYIISCLIHELTPLKNDSVWSKDRRYERNLIADSKVLIIGHGLIGKRVEKTLHALSASVEVFDPFKIEGHIDLQGLVISYDPDIIIFCASLNPTSKHILSADIFKSLKKNIVIINGARGELIDESAMIEFAKKNKEAKFYLDVFEKEPCDLSLFQGTQFIKSSHTAGVFNQLTKAMIDFEAQVISDFIKFPTENFKSKYSELSLQKRVTKDYLI